MDILECELCSCQNIINNDILKKNICAYCFLNFKKDEPEMVESVNFLQSFKALFDENIKYKNSILISNDPAIEICINDNCNKLNTSSINTKTISKFLRNGKIDGVIIPDMSSISLQELLLMENLFSNDVDLQVGIFTPSFINNNLNKFIGFKYVYSLFTVSKISTKNNFDIHGIESNTDYMLLKLKRGECRDLKLNKKIESIWEDHLYSGIFKILE